MPPRKAAEPVQETGKSTLELWDSVQATDPKYTKSFSRSGGFKGTATNATWLAKRATETFGPCGQGWGVTVLAEDYVKGAPILHEKHGPIGHEVIHVLRVELWYVLNGTRGAIQHFGQTVFVGSNRHGTFTDEEAPKKSLTDAISKALSLLGFASDIHLGMFDDNKYVNDRIAAVAEAAKPKGPTLEDLVRLIGEATDMAALKSVAIEAGALPEADRATLKPVYAAKLAALKAA